MSLFGKALATATEKALRDEIAELHREIRRLREDMIILHENQGLQAEALQAQSMAISVLSDADQLMEDSIENNRRRLKVLEGQLMINLVPETLN